MEGTNREQWLATRRIGSSDAANVCGIEGAFGSPLETYLEKMGALLRRQTEAMRLGLLLEPVVAQLYQEETGHEVRLTAPPGETRSFYRESLPWASATPDRFAGPAESPWILELKIASLARDWGQPGTDEIPLPYLLQVQHQMAVLDRDRADVAVLIAGTDFRHYTVRRHEELIASLMQIEAAFWDRLQRRDPPIDWHHPDTPKLLSLLHRPDEGKTVTLGPFASLAVEEYEVLGRTIKGLAERRDQAKARVIEEMQDAGVGLLPDGRRVRRKVKHVRQSTHPERKEIEFRVLKAEMSSGTRRPDHAVESEE